MPTSKPNRWLIRIWEKNLIKILKTLFMKKTILSFVLMASVSVLMLASCGENKTETTTTDSAMSSDTMSKMSDNTAMATEEQGVMVGGAKMVASKNIVENAAGSSDHTTLVSAVKAADLATTLSGTGPFTVFAPTNEAFNKVDKKTLDKLMMPEMKADLTKILTYHVVPGALMAADLKDGQKLTTVQGKTLAVTVKDGKVMVNGAKVTIPDVVSSNGVTHVIDGVVMPK
jgi:uncharacterized surface protein with fasciclin (FAS1) repeats